MLKGMEFSYTSPTSTAGLSLLLAENAKKGQMLEMPHSRPMPALGERCHELRNWGQPLFSPEISRQIREGMAKKGHPRILS